MPVKVRCPECQKVLNAPDAARGKAIKCPGCETKIRVPGDENSDSSDSGAPTAARTTARASTRASSKKRPGSDSADFLANLDLSKAVDTSTTLCPKCGAEIPEDAAECPKCGVDPDTGQLSSAARKRLSRRGPDPALYYSAAWSNSWAFTIGNLNVVVRTAIYMVLCSLLEFGCLFMVAWCSDMPPRVFWSACALVVYLITPGWIWHLTQVTIRATMSRKDDISDVSFDIFQNVALGIKLFVWGIVYVLPLFFIFPVALLMYPLAMIHFTTPVTKKAWLSPAMLGVLLRNLGPTLYYCFVAFVVNLAGFLGYFAIWFFFSASLAAVATAMQGSAAVGAMGWVMLGVAIGVSVLCTSFLAFASIFTMRVNGLLGYYFKDRLDLTLIVAEQKYVPGKRDQYDAFGERIKTKGEKTFVIVMAILVPLIVAGVGYYVWYTFWRKQ